ncbi:MAG: sensor histidine kinase [Dehalococcoidales bacterium]|nr:MAG: sensor histidine kinase [Dehalococcoidales bacterium]
MLGNPHFWGITVLLVIITIIYYGDLFGLGEWTRFGQYFFVTETLRDLHRSLLLIPLLYSAIIFKIPGAITVSVIAFIIVLPRAIFISPNPDPLLRSVGFMVLASLATILVAKERKQREEIGNLVQYPEEDPNPVLQVTKDGTIVYANQASWPILNTWGVQVDQPLPDQWRSLTAEINNKDSPKEYEIECDDRTFSLTIAPIKNGRFLNLYGLDITERKRLNENMQFYISEITKAQEEERKRISRELHDDTAQTVARLGLDIDYLIGSGEQPYEELNRQLEELRNRTDDLLEGIRRFSHDLRPIVLDETGLVGALNWLIDDLKARYESDVSLEVTGNPRRLLTDAELVLFRIAQEALQNISKHSQATRVLINLDFGQDNVILSISDNGQGFNLVEKLGDYVYLGKLGLIGMQERAKLLNGNLEIQSEPGEGTSIRVAVNV